MEGICKVKKQFYRWSIVAGTTAFPTLSSALELPQAIAVFRITGDDPGFDVVIRIDDDGLNRYLGPMLCIGNAVLIEKAGRWPMDALLRLRFRLILLRGDVPLGVIAERVVQWCKSPGSRAVRVKPTGSVWADVVLSGQ